MKYGWRITEDHIDKGASLGVCGPSDIDDETLARLKAGEGDTFELFDDDDNLYYVGLLLCEPNSNELFGPLDDYGKASGCTSIRVNGETI